MFWCRQLIQRAAHGQLPATATGSISRNKNHHPLLNNTTNLSPNPSRVVSRYKSRPLWCNVPVTLFSCCVLLKSYTSICLFESVCGQLMVLWLESRLLLICHTKLLPCAELTSLMRLILSFNLVRPWSIGNIAQYAVQCIISLWLLHPVCQGVNRQVLMVINMTMIKLLSIYLLTVSIYLLYLP